MNVITVLCFKYSSQQKTEPTKDGKKLQPMVLFSIEKDSIVSANVRNRYVSLIFYISLSILWQMICFGFWTYFQSTGVVFLLM